MWWSRSGGAVELEVPPSSAQDVGSTQLDPSEFDPAVDTLGAILRDYGTGAFDVDGMDRDTFKEACEAWARHILYAAPVPGEPSTKSDSVRRDWRGVRHFLRDHRQRESAYVSRSMGGMQQFVWGFVEELNRSVLGERNASANVSEQLDRMKHAIRANSVDQVKKEVSSAVNIVGKVMEERRQQQERQLASLNAQIRELGSQLEEARQESSLDPLTRLFNRKMFDVMLARAVDMRAVFRNPACLLLIDADHFKRVNDTYGHTVGDAVLKSLADKLTMLFPRKGDCIARYGGEEFAIIFPDTQLGEARKMADKLLKSVADMRIESGDVKLSITVSVGLSEVREDDATEAWIKRSDAALYRAKQNGRNRVETM